MLWPMLAMGALGAVQGERQADRVASINRANAEQTRYSPWTGFGPGKISSTGGGWFDGALSGGTAGLMMGQAMDANENSVVNQMPGTKPAGSQLSARFNPWAIS